MYSISIFYFTFYLFGGVYAPYVKLYRPTGLYSLNFKVRDALQIQDRSREHVLRFLWTGPNLRSQIKSRKHKNMADYGEDIHTPLCIHVA